MIRTLVPLVLLSAAAVASGEERIADIRQGTNLSVALAPDGGTLIVDLLGQLWSLPATGGGAVPLTPSGEQARNPRVSPDGRSVVYQRSSGDQWDLWLLDLGSGEQRPLTTSPYDEREPDFTPDGAVVFAANRTGHYCSVVDHARGSHRDAAHRGERHGVVSDGFRARARGLRSRALRRVVDSGSRHRRRDLRRARRARAACPRRRGGPAAAC